MEKFTVDPTIAYDVVELPSQGVVYKNNKKSLRVAYLTASDENILTSPNLIQNDSVIEELLKRKILDKDFDVNELLNEDKQAILIFLRNTAFGTEYELEIMDPKTNRPFTTKVDLSILKVKDFTLQSDSNGEYSYFMNNVKKNVTFKFLTNQQEKDLELIKNSKSDNLVVPTNTKRLEMMIKSIDGQRDQMLIYQFIQQLPIKDSQDFKKFVNENKPGIDLSIEVKTPSGEIVKSFIDFGVEFFRPFYGL
jgi:hypothetical protein